MIILAHFGYKTSLGSRIMILILYNCFILTNIFVDLLLRYFHIREVVVSAGVCIWSITIDFGSFWTKTQESRLAEYNFRSSCSFSVFRLTDINVKRISRCYLGFYVLLIRPDCHYMVRFVPEAFLHRFEQHNDMSKKLKWTRLLNILPLFSWRAGLIHTFVFF
jgi:hypothetical protein